LASWGRGKGLGRRLGRLFMDEFPAVIPEWIQR
jgi:hypothetical protein